MKTPAKILIALVMLAAATLIMFFILRGDARANHYRPLTEQAMKQSIADLRSQQKTIGITIGEPKPVDCGKNPDNSLQLYECSTSSDISQTWKNITDKGTSMRNFSRLLATLKWRGHTEAKKNYDSITAYEWYAELNKTPTFFYQKNYGEIICQLQLIQESKLGDINCFYSRSL